MGHVRAPYGVKGWVKVDPLTESVDGLLAYRDWWLGEGARWQSLEVLDGRQYQDGIIALIQGVSDRETAAKLRGKQIAVARAQLPPAPPGQYYWADLIGLSVVNRAGEDLGKVREVFATGANDVLVVQGGRERLLPFIDSVVIEVDLGAGRLLVDWGADY